MHELAHSIMLKLEMGDLLNYIRDYKRDNYIINVLDKIENCEYELREEYSFYLNISKLNFFEGWATYFSITCQLEMNGVEMNIPNVGDLYYSDTEDCDISINIQEASYLENGEKKYKIWRF